MKTYEVREPDESGWTEVESFHEESAAEDAVQLWYERGRWVGSDIMPDRIDVIVRCPEQRIDSPSGEVRMRVTVDWEPTFDAVEVCS